MATVNIRRLDDEVVRQLKVRAAENNRSLESEARHILEQSVENDLTKKMRAFRVRAQQFREETGGQAQTPSHVLIREDRDGGHGSA